MSAKKDAASSSAAGQSDKDASEEVHAEKSVDKLNVREFYERFCIPNGLSVQLVDGKAVSTEKSADNAIYFTKEQFNVGLLFPLPSLFKEFLHFTQIPPTYIHPNIVWVLMGCTFLVCCSTWTFHYWRSFSSTPSRRGKLTFSVWLPACLPSNW